jgi:serine acetyltransferase
MKQTTATCRLSSESASRTSSECPVGQPSAHRQALVRAIRSEVTCVLKEATKTIQRVSHVSMDHSIETAVRLGRGLAED